MALKLKGSTSGFVAIDAPSVAGNNTLILPENTGSAHQILANDITAGVTTFTQITVSRNGDLTVPGTISIGGTLTYEDVTSVDSVGIVTARGLSIFGNTTGLSVTGVSTFAGNVLPSSDSSIDIGLTGTRFRNAYVDTYYGDGSNLTGVNETTINTNGANRLIIGSATANTLSGVSNLIFDGSNLKVGNTANPSDYNQTDIILGTHSGHSGMTILSSPSHGGFIMFSDNDGGGTNAYRGQIEYGHSDDYMRFLTDSTERLRIHGWGDVNIANKLNVAGITTTTALTVNGATTPATITHTGGNALHLTRSSKTLGFNANYGAGDVKSQIDVSSGMGLALAVADNEKIRMTSGGNFNIGGDYAQTSSQLYIKGGTGGGGNFNGLEIKHSNTNSSAGAGDGPAILLNGYYSSAEWQFAKICSVNSGSGFGADFQVHVHPSAGSQGASLVKAVTIVGNGSNAGNTKVLGSLAIGQHASSSISNNFPGSALVQTGMYICAYNGDNLITNASQGGGSSTLYIGNQAIQTSSDKRIKKNIVDTTSNVLDKIKQVRVVDFDWDDPSDTASVNRNSRGKWTGCLAQEMVDIFPHVINAPRKEDNSLDYDSDRTWLVDYGHLVPTLIKGMQELSAENTALKSRLDAAGL